MKQFKLELWLKPFVAAFGRWHVLGTLHQCHCGRIRLALDMKVLQSPARNWLPWEQLCHLRHHDLVFIMSFHSVSERLSTSHSVLPGKITEIISVFLDGNALSSLAPKSVL